MGKHFMLWGNRTHEKAVTFAEKYQVTKVYDDFHEMFTDLQVDVIYITTPAQYPYRICQGGAEK